MLKTEVTDYTFEFTGPVASAMRQEYGADFRPMTLAMRITVVGEPGSWTPYVHRIDTNGEEADIPFDFRPGGAVCLECTAPTPQEAGSALFHRYLSVAG